MVRGLFPIVAHSAQGDVIKGPADLRIAPLPAERFCSGHLVHVQRGGDTAGCLSVHATFTEYGDAGKRWRFLEAKLWALNEPAYYTAGRYLTFVRRISPTRCRARRARCTVQGTRPEVRRRGSQLRATAEAVWRYHVTEAMKRSVRLRANQRLMSRQTHALRDALAIARVLNAHSSCRTTTAYATGRRTSRSSRAASTTARRRGCRCPSSARSTLSPTRTSSR